MRNHAQRTAAVRHVAIGVGAGHGHSFAAVGDCRQIRFWYADTPATAAHHFSGVGQPVQRGADG